MIIVTTQPDKVIQVAREHNIEAKKIGEVTKAPVIVLNNQGLNQGTRELKFDIN
jgi:hydrogenase maturation factor